MVLRRLESYLQKFLLNVLIAGYKIDNLVLIRSDVCVSKSTWVNISIHQYVY